MTRSPGELEEAKQRRQQTSDDLVKSDARKKLVVAGPGTGETHNFKRVLERSGGGLAITFIRALAEDLKRDLGDLAQVNTFHGYTTPSATTTSSTASSVTSRRTRSRSPSTRW